jgi:hypothetical protein
VELGGFFIFSANAGCLRMEADRRFSFYSPQDFKQKESIMKTKHGILFGFVAILLVTMFTFSACNTDADEDEPPAPLAGTSWTNSATGSSITFKYVGASKWEMYRGTATTDDAQGYGTYALSDKTVTMRIAGDVFYTGTLDSASAPTSMNVTSVYGGTSTSMGAFTKK